MVMRISIVFLLLLAATPAIAEDKKPNGPKLASKTPGIEVGKKAPAFTLTDQAGKTQSLAELGKGKNVAIIFYRSGSW